MAGNRWKHLKKGNHMMPFVNIGGTPLSMYFVMGLSGFLFAIFIGLMKCRAFNLHAWDILRIATFVIIGGLLGARLFAAFGYILLYGREPNFWTAENWLEISRGVGVFYGGLLGSIGMAALRAKFSHIDMKSMFNVFAYGALAFLSIARIGCYCAGCCYGIELASGARFPVQLVEAGFCMVALIVFLILKPERRWPSIPLLPLYMITYSVGRFVLEFFRGDEGRGIWLLSSSQWIALVLIAVAIVWLHKKNHQTAESS